MIVLYVISIFIAWMFSRPRTRKDEIERKCENGKAKGVILCYTFYTN